MDYYTIDSTFSFVKDTMKYYSQNSGKDVPLIDKFVLNKHINYWKKSNSKKVDGIFVEVGAFDGITYSNTKAFEESLDWKGLLIEPSPASFQKLTTNRPNTINVSTAISKENDEFLEFTGDNCCRRFDKHFKKMRSGQWKRLMKLNLSPSTLDVKVDKISNILNKNNIKYIDFLSIDVNGSELDVLETMDWSIPVYVIAINTSIWGKFGKSVANSCRELLSSKGFIMDEKLSMDEIWINNDYFRKVR